MYLRQDSVGEVHGLKMATGGAAVPAVLGPTLASHQVVPMAARPPFGRPAGQCSAPRSGPGLPTPSGRG